MVVDAAVRLIQSLILDTASHFIDSVILLSLLGFSVADSSTDFGIEAAKRDSSTIAGCMETGKRIFCCHRCVIIGLQARVQN